MLMEPSCFCGFLRFHKLVELTAQSIQQPVHVLMRHLTAVYNENTVIALYAPDLNDQIVDLALQPGQIVFHPDYLVVPHQIRTPAPIIAARALLRNSINRHQKECF